MYAVRFLSVLLVILMFVSMLGPISAVPAAWAQADVSLSDECVCGPKAVTVLLFDFADVTHGSSSTPEYYSGIVRAMNASFYTQSYGKMWIVGGEVYGWYSTSLRLSELKVTTWDLDWTDAGKLETLAKNKAFDLHVTGVVFGVFAGPVWAWATGHPSVLTIVGEGAHEETWGTWTWGLRGFMHEFGHNLGLPDLYNYENLDAEPVGKWDLMEEGEEELSAYSRLKLGWLPRDSVTTIDSRNDITIVIVPLDLENGMRALKVQLSASNSYYLAETRRTPDGLRLVVYYIQGVIESGKGSIVLEGVMAVNDLRVLVGKKIASAFILLAEQPEGLKVESSKKETGEKAQLAAEALRSASSSIDAASSANRVQGLSEATQELAKAWESFGIGDFDSAKGAAEKAKALAESATAPASSVQTTTTAVGPQATLTTTQASPSTSGGSVSLLLVGVVVAATTIAVLVLTRRRKRTAPQLPLPASTPSTETPSKFCINCGVRMQDAEVFCRACGTRQP